MTSLPKIVTREEWQRARDQLSIEEKTATKGRDALNPEWCRLPRPEGRLPDQNGQMGLLVRTN